MKKLIEFIKRIFIRRPLSLNEGKIAVEEKYLKHNVGVGALADPF